MGEFTVGLITVDVQRARAYVLAHGGLREQARLRGILDRTRPEKEIVKELEALQNPDGGFPFLQNAGGPSSVDTTCCVLAQCKDLPPLAGSPMATRAVAFLRRSQHVDGAWREELGAPWTSGEAGTAYLTANALYTVVTLDPDHTDPVRRGDRWLRAALERVEYRADPQTLALGGAVSYALGGAAGLGAAERCMGILGAKEDPATDEVAWHLACALEVRMGGSLLVPIMRRLAWLAAKQNADGSWPSEAGFLTEATLTALRLFKGYGLIKGVESDVHGTAGD